LWTMKRERIQQLVTLASASLFGISLIFLGIPRVNSKEPEKPAPKEPITYAKHVSRIIQDRCQTCHHAGTAAPFSLLTYKDAVRWADTIREVVTEKRMPPWHADPHYGTWSNDRRLTKQEMDTLIGWLDTGMQTGDDRDLPPARTYADGWVIGKPDVIFELPAEQKVPASGVVNYQYFVTPTNFKEDVWVQAAEARPGNRGVVHHIIVSFRDAKAKERSGGRNNGLGDGFIVGTAPGDMPLILPPGTARRIPAGADLVWQMHYTPNGKEARDKSQVGFIFYKGKEPPKFNSQTRGAMNTNFAIPPGDSNYLTESEWTVPRDTLLLSFMPHMHLRGKDFKYTAEYPDGHKEVLLSVPHYDFNWQTSYRLAQPVRLPKGTRIHCVAHFDNSAANPANPDPKKEVTWGDQTFEEMMIGWVDFIWEQPEREAIAEGFKVF
jgi:mono/diheme cytochrome c family protein